MIKNDPGIQAWTIAEQLNDRRIKTVERQIKALIEKELVERRGSRKTGGLLLEKCTIDRLIKSISLIRSAFVYNYYITPDRV